MNYKEEEAMHVENDIAEMSPEDFIDKDMVALEGADFKEASFRAYKSNRTSYPIALLSILLAALLIIIVLMQFGIIGTVYAKKEKAIDWFDTPEDAIRFYINCVAQGQFETAIASFAATDEVLSVQSSFYSQLDVVGGYTPLYQYNMPEEYAAYRSLILQIEQGRAATSTHEFATSLLIGDRYVTTLTFSEDAQEKKQQIDAIITRLDPDLLQQTSVIRIDIVYSEFQMMEEYRAHMEKHVNAFGFDGYIEYMALVEMEGKNYVVPFAMVSSNHKWKIFQMSSGILQIEHAAGIPITEEEYKNYT